MPVTDIAMTRRPSMLTPPHHPDVPNSNRSRAFCVPST